MFDGLKKRINSESVLFERLRTVLYFSKNRKIQIWAVLLKPDQYISSARIVSGVVKGIVNGSSAEPSHKRYIGGEFTFDDIEPENKYEFHNMDEIFAISFYPIKTIPDDLKRGDVLNRMQHLTPFTGFQSGSDTNEWHYYRVLSSAPDNK
jgi:hypothetical protein